MKILVAVPTFENIQPETFRSIYALHTGEHGVLFDFVKGYDCAVARNSIVKMALDKGADYVLMVDSDIILPDDTILKFLERPVDICFGVYPHKNTTEKKAELFKVSTAHFDQRFKYSELTMNRMEIGGAGFGCAFVRMDVFKDLKYPWFDYVTYENGEFLGEDLYFCDRARKKGYVLWADTRIRCGHLSRCFQYE